MRRLALRTERLTELTTDDLAAVHGAQAPLPTQMCTGAYPTFNCGALIALVTGVVTGIVTTSTG